MYVVSDGIFGAYYAALWSAVTERDTIESPPQIVTNVTMGGAVVVTVVQPPPRRRQHRCRCRLILLVCTVESTPVHSLLALIGLL